MSQLAKLAQPIDPRFIEKKPGKYESEFVSHPVIEQYLIGITGRIPRQEIVREIYDGEKLTGCVLRLSTVIDGNEVVVEEVGDDDGQASNNGARLKNAVSDAYKRCCMRMTLALRLWAGADNYFLDKILDREDESGKPGAADAPRITVSETPQTASPTPDAATRATASAPEPVYVGTVDVESVTGHNPETSSTARATAAQWTVCRRRATEAGIDVETLPVIFNLRYGFSHELASKATATDFADWLKQRATAGAA